MYLISSCTKCKAANVRDSLEALLVRISLIFFSRLADTATLGGNSLAAQLFTSLQLLYSLINIDAKGSNQPGVPLSIRSAFRSANFHSYSTPFCVGITFPLMPG